MHGARAGTRRRGQPDRAAVRQGRDHEDGRGVARRHRRRSRPARCRSTSALGIGGLPRGRVVEIFGPESSGKTTLCYHVIAEAQRKGGLAAFIDAEHAMDPTYARRIGVNVDELLVSQPDNGEQALEIAEMLVRTGAIDVLVIDSVAALVPKAEIEGEMGDSHVGLQARLMSQALRKLTGTLNRTGTSASSPTSCARRSASCSARRRRPPAAARSSSTPRSGSTSAASRRSRTAPRRSATACASRSSRTRWRRRSGRPSSTSSTARASPGRDRSSTSRSRRRSCRSRARTSRSAMSGWARAGRTSRRSWSSIPTSPPPSSRPSRRQLPDVAGRAGTRSAAPAHHHPGPRRDRRGRGRGCRKLDGRQAGWQRELIPAAASEGAAGRTMSSQRAVAGPP